MKKIYCHTIKMSQSYNERTGEPIYEVETEDSECEYSEEWLKDDEDPIKDYVENAIENVSDKTFSEEGYSWDEGKTIDFFEVIPGDTYHILYRNGEPIELYHVK